VYRSSSITKLK